MKSIENKQDYNAVDLLAKEIAKAADFNANKYEYDKTFISLIYKNSTGISDKLTDDEKTELDKLGECDDGWYCVRINGNFYKLECKDTNIAIDTEVKVTVPCNNWNKMFINFKNGGGLENVSNFQGGTSGDSGIVNLTWVKPASAERVIIKRKRSTPFNNVIDDGDIIAVTSGNTIADTLPSLWYSYYYRTLTNAGDLYNGKDNSIMIPAITRGKYLYNVGDRCTAITGGWFSKVLVTDIPNLTYNSATFESTHIRLYAKYDSSYYLYSAVQTANKVDFTGFTKLCAEFRILSLNTYDLTENADYTTIRNRDMPYYSYADTYYNSSYPAVTPEQCPYVIASYCTNWYGTVYYSVKFTDKKPELYYDNDRQICIRIEATSSLAREVRYNAKTLAVYQKYKAFNTTVLKLKCPVDTPDTSITDYMGGAYSQGYTYCYAFDGFTDPYKIPDTRFFIGTHSQNDDIYNDLVTKAYKTYPTDVGTFVIEAAITDLDTSVVPNIPRGYVSAGAFESDVMLLSVWLQE